MDYLASWRAEGDHIDRNVAFEGGVVFAENFAVLSMSGCLCTHNMAQFSSMSALSRGFVVEISTSIFAGNTANEQGGLSVEATPLNISLTEFNGNLAAINGASISMVASIIFEQIYPTNGIIYNCSFTGNVVVAADSSLSFDEGAAIYIDQSSVAIDKSIFDGNEAGFGGKTMKVSYYCSV